MCKKSKFPIMPLLFPIMPHCRTQYLSLLWKAPAVKGGVMQVYGLPRADAVVFSDFGSLTKVQGE